MPKTGLGTIGLTPSSTAQTLRVGNGMRQKCVLPPGSMGCPGRLGIVETTPVDDMGTLKEDLENAGLDLIETHISWVFLDERDVYKVKRPIDFGFLDFTTLHKREEACRAEVRLNQRLAPDVYLGVLPITLDGSAHRVDGDGPVVDWAVHMRRLSAEHRADVLLEAGMLEPSQVDALADHIARFHENARCDEVTSRHGEPSMIRRNVRENFEQTRETIAQYLDQPQAAEIEEWQLTVLQDEPRFEARIEAQRVRDGHGDLRLEHVYFEPDGTIAIIDCIEFNDRFRYGDVCADIAFLSMDLSWHGRVDLAERLLARYARESHDFGLYRVVDFYESYRAFVRGKIASFLAADQEASHATRERATREARRYFMLALAYERPPLVPPRVVAVTGLIASGKSRTATLVGELLAAPVLSSDRTRKFLAGHRPEETLGNEPWSGAYSKEATAEVYAALFANAAAIVASGRPVVIDASFRTRAAREEVRELASRAGVPFMLIECTAPRELLRERLKKRETRATHESDARTDLLDEFERRFEPIDELQASEHVRLDTSRDPAENRARLTALFAP